MTFFFLEEKDFRQFIKKYKGTWWTALLFEEQQLNSINYAFIVRWFWSLKDCYLNNFSTVGRLRKIRTVFQFENYRRVSCFSCFLRECHDEVNKSFSWGTSLEVVNLILNITWLLIKGEMESSDTGF